MVSIIMHRRNRTLAAKPVTSNLSSTPQKLLKLCTQCRSNKTRCDAVSTTPHPCTYCVKRNLACHLEAYKPAKRDHEYTEILALRVHRLQLKLDSLVSRKSSLIASCLETLSSRQSASKLSPPPTPPRAECVERTDIAGPNSRKSTEPSGSPSIEEIQALVYSPPDLSDSYIFDSNQSQPSLCIGDLFTIQSNPSCEKISVSYTEASELFHRFNEEFAPYLPIFPDTFFQLDLRRVHGESSLLFWSIIAASLQPSNSPAEHKLLASHVHSLVAITCWTNTPRSIYTLMALLVLTTWPLPDLRALQFQDSITVKYLSLMKSLSLQFGLHKLSFIHEFSKKTHMVLDEESHVNNILRERIYKLISINSNYWLVFLGLKASNYDASSQDYMINKASNTDIVNQDQFPENDNFINSLLKVSLVQLKMNENMNELIETPSNVAKLINLNMFEKILEGYSRSDSVLMNHLRIALSLQYSKLQLYVYYLSEIDISVDQYREIVQRTLKCCSEIVELFESLFPDRHHLLVPIHYRFSIKLASFVLMVLHSTPLLNSIGQYDLAKKLFNRCYKIFSRSSAWNEQSKALFTVIQKFNSCKTRDLLALRSSSKNFFAVQKMSNYLVASIRYELLYQVYRVEKSSPGDLDVLIDWKIYGLDVENPEHKSIIDYLERSEPILESS